MELDDTLRAYLHDYLRQKNAHASQAQVDAFLGSDTCRHLVGGFHTILEKTMHELLAAPVVKADEPMPLPLKDLSVPDEPDLPIAVPVTDAAPPSPALLPDVTFRLPNARAGDAYRQRLEALPPTGDSIVFCELQHPADVTLGVDSATGVVTGAIDTPGDYPLTVVYQFASEPGHLRQATFRLTVTPDPKKMWQDLPTSKDAPYWKADADCAALVDTDFRILAASKRGRSHAHVGSFRDDDFRIAQLAGSGGANWQVAVLADGAGSAKYSRQGAAIICAQALARLTAALQGDRGAVVDDAVATYQRDRAADEAGAAATLRAVLSGVVGNAAYYAAKGIMDECAAAKDSLQAVPKDYASTALIAICKRYPFGTLSAAYWVGDGAIGVYSEVDGITLLGDVDSGEFSGQTRFLEGAEVAQDALLRRTRFVLSERLTALVLMTDGVSDPRFETDARLARPADWHALWRELAPVVEGGEQGLLDWLDFWSPGNHDDRTIALVMPRKADHA
jgi:hypothetical protein